MYWRGTTISTWSSPDLISFNDAQTLTVFPDKADDPEWVTWAPEWIENPDEDNILLFWSGGHFNSTYVRRFDRSSPPPPHTLARRALKNIWAATIDVSFDASTLSAPFKLLDAGYTTIDGDMVKDADDVYHLFFKDERGSNSFDTDDKAVRVVTSKSPKGPFNADEISDLLSPTLTEGPSAFIVPNPAEGEAANLMFYDCFMNGRYGVSESDFLDKGWASVGDSSCDGFGDSVSFPDGARHGSVVCVSEDEMTKILEHWG
jgi:hypothetical protein